MVLDIFSNKWCIQESNRSRNSHRSLELGFLTIGRCSRSHSEGVRSVGCLMARSHCTADGSRTADVVQFYESAWCWIGALIVMTRKVRSFAPVVADLAAESPHLWWTAESSTSARIWSPFPSDRRGTQPKVPKKITKCKKSWILAICHLKADGQKADGHGKNMNQNGVDQLVPCSCTMFQQPQRSVTFWYFPNSMHFGTPFFQLSSKPIQMTRFEGLCAGVGFWTFAHQWQLRRHCLQGLIF